MVGVPQSVGGAALAHGYCRSAFQAETRSAPGLLTAFSPHYDRERGPLDEAVELVKRRSILDKPGDIACIRRAFGLC